MAATTGGYRTLLTKDIVVETLRFLPLAEPWLGEECADAVKAQVLTSFVGPGKATRDFGQALEEFIGVPHCVLTTSGTVALSVAAVALGLKPGDEILVPAYGVISTINAFAVLGLRPRLVDIDRTTACMDPDQLATRLTLKTKAICFVNFAGYTGENLLRVKAIAAERGIPLIEDAACALGHRYNGKRAGSFGDAGILSFSVPKALTTGQGGAVLTSSDATADRAAEYVDHGDLRWRETNLNRGIGTNLRFNDVLAALGLAQMQLIDERLARKRRAYGRLREALGANLYAVPGDQAPLHYVVFADDPDALVSELRARNIGAVRQYRSIYQHPAYAELNDSAFPNSDFWTEAAVYLPFGLSLSENDADRIAAAVMESRVALRAY